MRSLDFYLDSQPPSVHAAQAWAAGQPGATVDLAVLTIERAVPIGLALWLAGTPRGALLRSALAASTGVTAYLMIYYWWQR